MVAKFTEILAVVVAQGIEIQEIPRAEAMRRLGHKVGSERRVDEDLCGEIDLFVAQNR